MKISKNQNPDAKLKTKRGRKEGSEIKGALKRRKKKRAVKKKKNGRRVWRALFAPFYIHSLTFASKHKMKSLKPQNDVFKPGKIPLLTRISYNLCQQRTLFFFLPEKLRGHTPTENRKKCFLYFQQSGKKGHEPPIQKILSPFICMKRKSCLTFYFSANFWSDFFSWKSLQPLTHSIAKVVKKKFITHSPENKNFYREKNGIVDAIIT